MIAVEVADQDHIDGRGIDAVLFHRSKGAAPDVEQHGRSAVAD